MEFIQGNGGKKILILNTNCEQASKQSENLKGIFEIFLFSLFDKLPEPTLVMVHYRKLLQLIPFTKTDIFL